MTDDETLEGLQATYNPFPKFVESFAVIGAVSPLSPVRSEDECKPPSTNVIYKSQVLDYFPKKLDENSTLVRDIMMFCLPEGLKLSEKCKRPSYFSFVLTELNGDRMYVSCLAFSERVREDQVPPTPVPSPSTIDNFHEGEHSPIGTSPNSTPIPAPRIPRPNISTSDPILQGDLRNRATSKPKLADLRAPSDMHLPRVRKESVRRNTSFSFKEKITDPDAFFAPPKQLSFTNFYITKCLCFVSRFPYLRLMKEVLTRIYSQVVRSHPVSLTVEQYVSNCVLNIPLPPPGIFVRIPLPSLTSNTVDYLFCSSPSTTDFPVADFPMRLLFMSLDLDNLFKLLAAALLERKILLCSQNYALLSIAAETLITLMYPLQWPHVFVPILPRSLLECVEAPTPFIMGLHTSFIQDIPDLNDVVVVYLDSNKITMSTAEPLPQLPEQTLLTKKLRKHIHPELHSIGLVSIKEGNKENLQDNVTYTLEDNNQRGIRIAFLHFFVTLFKNYYHYLDPSTLNFDKSSFLKNHPNNNRDFLDALVDTQAFTRFLAERAQVRSLNPFDGLMDGVYTLKMLKFRDSKTPIIRFPIPEPTPSEEPTEYKGIFPDTLKEKLFLCPRGEELSAICNQLLEINYDSAALYLFRARLTLEFTGQRLRILPDLKRSWELDEQSIPPRFLDHIFSKLSESELEESIAILGGAPTEYQGASSDEELRSEEKVDIRATNNSIKRRKESPMLKMAYSYLQKRKQAKESVVDDDDESLMLIKNVSKGHSYSSSDTARHPGFEVKDHLALLKQLQLPRVGRMSKEKFIKFAFQVELVDNEENAIKLYMALSGDKTWSNSIKINRVRLFIEAINAIYADNTEWHKKVLNLGPKEFVLWVSVHAAERNKGDKGSLVLTSKRVIFYPQKPDQQLQTVDLKDVIKADVRSAFPMPSRLIIQLDKQSELTYTVWNSAERDIWVVYLREMHTAYKVSRDLSDQRFVNRAVHYIILSKAAYRVVHRHSKAMLSYETYPQDSWAQIGQKLQRQGLLNTDHVWEETPRNAVIVANDLLLSILHLFFSCVEHDVHSVDFESLSKSPAYKTFMYKTSELQVVDLTPLTPKEKIAFFINLYNTLIVHSYIICGSFPSGEMDFRYICRSAYYSVGGSAYCLSDIYQGILRGNQSYPWFTEPPFGENDPRLIHALKKEELDPRIHFTLSMHNSTSPNVHVVSPEHLEDVLQRATEMFCRDVSMFEVSVAKRTVYVPKQLYWYRFDFGNKEKEVLRWVCSYLLGQRKKELTMLLDSNTPFAIQYKIDWTPEPKPMHVFHGLDEI